MSSTIKAAVLPAAGQAVTGCLIWAKAAALPEGGMKTMSLTTRNPALAVLLAGVILVSGPAVVAASAPEQTAAPVPTDKKQELKVKWEYTALKAPDVEKLAPKGSKDSLTDGLNALGEQGWELVAVVPATPEPGGILIKGGPGGPPGPGMPGGGAPPLKPTTYLFKRPK
jgi:hypothetical protein